MKGKFQLKNRPPSKNNTGRDAVNAVLPVTIVSTSDYAIFVPNFSVEQKITEIDALVCHLPTF